jgi:hypothetical protein
MLLKQITNRNEFHDWLMNSKEHRHEFSINGALALQDFIENYSNEIKQDIVFNPESWAFLFKEYKDLEEFKKDNYDVDADDNIVLLYEDLESLEQLRNDFPKPWVIEFNGGFIYGHEIMISKDIKKENK